MGETSDGVVINVPKTWTFSDEMRMAGRVAQIVVGSASEFSELEKGWWALDANGYWQLAKQKVGAYKLTYRHGESVPLSMKAIGNRVILELGLQDLNY